MPDKNKAIKPIKIVIVDDEKAYRVLIKKIILKDKRLKFYAEYSSAGDFINSLDSLFNIPHVCLMDMQLKNMSGIECIKEVKKDYPNIYFIMMTAHPDPKILAEVKELGIDYIEKGTILETLIDKVIMAKTSFFEESLESQIISLKKESKSTLIYVKLLESLKKSQSKIKSLTKTELKIVKLINEDKSYNEIAEILKVDTGTVRTHFSNAKRKLELPNLLKYIFNGN